MRNTLSPLGIFIAHTLPAFILLALYSSMLSVVWPLLEPGGIALWKTYGACLVVVVLLSTIYGIALVSKRGSVHWIYGLLVFAIYVPMLWAFMEHSRDLIPRNIPRWMIEEDSFLYAIRLLSIPLAHALFVLVASSLPAGVQGKPLRDLLISIAIPLGCYLFVQVVEPWRHGVDFERHAWIVLMVVLVVLFLFFLFRAIVAMVRVRRTSDGWAIFLRFLVALALPLIGLMLNNGVWKHNANGIFGDLGHWGFYTVAALNGLVVIWGSSDDPRIRFTQFILRAIGFSYVLYFFVLFLPLLPVSIVAIVAVGIGFLLLAPVLLFIVQGMQLLNDLRFLKAHHSTTSLAVIGSVGLMVIPAVITARYMQQRHSLHSALDHVYQSDPSRSISVDGDALRSVMEQVDANKNRRMWQKSRTPFLTPWYNYIVLDNLTVSDEKLGHLHSIFLDDGETPPRPRRWRPAMNNVLLDTATVRSVYDVQQQAWRSWVDLSMTNTSEGFDEYVTEFDLPAGAWISDEYLMIEGQKVMGILAEKKAATWIYQQIVNFRQDPSLTRYIGPDKVQVRVFPFGNHETRQAGFEVLHKEPITLDLNGRTVILGDPNNVSLMASIASSDGSATYIPASVKSKLPLISRNAHYHFIVDGTEKQRDQRTYALDRIEGLMNEGGLDPSTVTLEITDMNTNSVPWGENARTRFAEHAGEGGFFTDRAIRKVLIDACSSVSTSRPVIVLVPSLSSDSSGALGIWLDGLDDVAACLPEGDAFFVVDAEHLSKRSLTDPLTVLQGLDQMELKSIPVVAWPDLHQPKAYLPNDSNASVVADLDHESPATLDQRNWDDALTLDGRWHRHVLDPAGGTKAWRALVKGSFQAQILSPVTAWMCLENEAQRNALLKKQEELLNASAALDAGEEEITNMSEPGMLWILLPALLFLWWRRR